MDNEIPILSDEEISSDEEASGSPPHPCMSHEAMIKLYEMRQNNQLCDGVIHCLADDKYLNIHRAILCACSSYFKWVTSTCWLTSCSNQYHCSALFTTQLHQNENTFDIPEVPSDSMEWIIKFAYLRDTSFIDVTNVVQIYIIADYFGIFGITKACINFIIKILSPVNCIGYWIMAKYVSIISTSTFIFQYLFFSIADIAA